MIERRDLPRLQARYAVSLWKPVDGTFTRTTTENLTSRGFFCRSAEQYQIGDELQATLELPALGWNGRPKGHLTLQCHVEVVRTGPQEPGVACRIKDFTIVTDGLVDVFGRAS